MRLDIGQHFIRRESPELKQVTRPLLHKFPHKTPGGTMTGRTIKRIILPIAFLAACSNETVPTGGGADLENAVSARRVADGVRIVNLTGRAVGYLVTNKDGLALASPCLDPGPTCMRLQPGDTVVVPEADIIGRDSKMTTAVVLHWIVEPNPAGGYRAAEVGEMNVKM